MAKNIIVCMDGTGNEYGDNITNVIETYKLARKTARQVVYYDAGVGTGGYLYDDGLGKIIEAFDKSTGSGVHQNVEEAYLYLMEVWDPGDKIFLFGFSRGAFSARSLAGMLHKIGLLPREHDNQLEYASKYYLDKKYRKHAAGFKRDMCRACPVHFIGVWDTVDSTMLTEGNKFTDTTLNEEVSHGYHAIAINEKRKDFPVSIWNKPANKNQTIEQVWFAGVHSNVSGWYTNRDLSSIPLYWMMQRAITAGMLVDKAALKTIKAQQNSTGQIHESYEGFWFLRGKPRYRSIPSGSNIHRSVIKRLQADAEYKKAVAKIGMPRKYKTVEYDP